MAVDISPFVFQKPGPSFFRSDAEKVAWNKLSQASIDLKDYPEGNEMCGVRIAWPSRFDVGDNITAYVEFYDNATGSLLWKGSYSIPSPASKGFAYWSSYDIYFWIGHAQYEIFKAMMVRADVHFVGNVLTYGKGKDLDVHQSVHINVTDSSYIPPNPDEPVPVVRHGKIIELYTQDISAYTQALLNTLGLQTSSDFVGGNTAALIANKDKVISAVNGILASSFPGWKLNQITFTTGLITLEFEDIGSPLLIAGIIVAAIAVIAIVFGVFITKWKEYDWKKEAAKAQQQTQVSEQKDTTSDLLQRLVDSGVVKNADDAALIIEAMLKNPPVETPSSTDWASSVKEIMLIAIVGVAVVILLQQFAKGGK